LSSEKRAVVQTWKCEQLRQRRMCRNRGTMKHWNSEDWAISITSSHCPRNKTSFWLFVTGKYLSGPLITVSTICKCGHVGSIEGSSSSWLNFSNPVLSWQAGGKEQKTFEANIWQSPPELFLWVCLLHTEHSQQAPVRFSAWNICLQYFL